MGEGRRGKGVFDITGERNWGGKEEMVPPPPFCVRVCVVCNYLDMRCRCGIAGGYRDALGQSSIHLFTEVNSKDKF